MTAPGCDPALSLTLRGEPKSEVARAQQSVAAFLAHEGEDAMAVARAELMVEETALNVLVHGFAAGETPEVRLCVRREASFWVLDFEDRGCPFDPTAAALPAPAPSLAEARIGGFGLPLIRRTAAALRYERTADGRNLFSVVLPPGRAKP